MTRERLTDEQLLAWRDKLGGPSVGVVTELLVLRARVAKLEAALKDIANTYDDSWHAGSQERRIGDEARAALKDAPQ